DPAGMSNYKRVRVAGGTYFFTLRLASDERSDLVQHVDVLREAYAATTAEAPVRTEAIVVLPNHLHAVWTLPPGDDGYSERWRRIKARFSRGLSINRRSMSKERRREKGVWQRRFWEHAIRDEADFKAHLRYCWGNPVKHGYVARPADWALSSIHRDIREGRIDAQWSGEEIDGTFGE
ncbi:MAG: transposase, partial [Pseudomonadota bacterium]